MKKDPVTKPFLKWAGGKRQLLPQIRKYVPDTFNNYYEPFLGGGALLFDLHPSNAIINDMNAELTNCYRVIRDNLDELMVDLVMHKNDEAYYYQMRGLDRLQEYMDLSPVKRASRIIYLNKTCYNGLFRVNRQGYFNVPFGRYKNPKIVNEPVLKAASSYLSSRSIEIRTMDYREALTDAKKGDFVYLDPPYDPVSDTSSFTGYSVDGFGKDEQKRLKDVFVSLDKRGCRVMLSNSATDFIMDLYKEYHKGFMIVSATRSINSVAAGRGRINEILIMNY